MPRPLGPPSFNSKALDILGGSLKQKIRFGILKNISSILNVFLSGICSFFILCTVIRVTITKKAVIFFHFILYTNCFFLASYSNDGTHYKNIQDYQTKRMSI